MSTVAFPNPHHISSFRLPSCIYYDLRSRRPSRHSVGLPRRIRHSLPPWWIRSRTIRGRSLPSSVYSCGVRVAVRCPPPAAFTSNTPLRADFLTSTARVFTPRFYHFIVLYYLILAVRLRSNLPNSGYSLDSSGMRRHRRRCLSTKVLPLG